MSSVHNRGRILRWQGEDPLPTIPYVNFASEMLKCFEDYEDKVALVDASSGKFYTYRQLQTKISQMKKSLVSAGVNQGDAVLMVCRNHIDTPAALLTILHIGAICVPVGTDLTIGELTHIVGVSKARWAVVTEGSVTKVTEAFSSYDSSSLRQLWILGAASGSHPTLGERISTVISDSYEGVRNVFSSHETVAMMPFSSGTTGLPKGVMLSHRNLVTNHVILKYLQSLNELSTINIYDSTLLAMPIYHMYGYNVTMNTLMTGGKVIILPKFSVRLYFEAIQNYKVTFAPLVPYIANLLIDSPMMKKYDLSSLLGFATGSAPIAETTLSALMQKTGKNAIQGYGMTETTGLATINRGEPGCKPNEIGHILPFFEGKVIDTETGETLGEDEIGELCLRGPSIMLGYANNPKATAETLDDDWWLHTGDLAYYDKDDIIYLTDRIKDLIKVKAHQVAPTELENLIQTLENVREVAVAGVPNERLGEAPRAWIVPVPGTTIDKMAVMKHVAENVAPYKQLAGGVEVVQSLPRNHIGKILRKELKKAFVSTVSKL